MLHYKEKINRYTREVAVGDFPQVYRKILDSLSEIRRLIQKNHPDLTVGGLYPGYMDISFFTVVSPELKARQLKLVLVYVHGTAPLKHGWPQSIGACNSDIILFWKRESLGLSLCRLMARELIT